VHRYFRTWIGMAAAAALGVVVMTGTALDARAQAAAGAQNPAPPAQPAKQVKDAGEYDIYNDVIKDSNPLNAKKLLTDLDTWTQKYPETAFKDERKYYYLQGYAGTGQPAKVLDVAKDLLSKGLDGLKSGLTNPGFVLQTLFMTAANTAVLASNGAPSQDQLDIGTNAAKMLLDFAKEYFVPEKKPAQLSDADWATGRKQVEDAAKGALFQIALYPATSVLKKNPKDPATCGAAEPALAKALQDYPDSGQVALQLANTLLCQQAATPAKAQQALYEYARAVAMPLGPPVGLDADSQKKFDAYLQRIYVAFHGSDEGLQQLRDLAAKSPLPPADLKVKSKTEIAMEKEEEFRTKNPQLAMWMGIKAKLADTDGQQYFEGQLKDSDMSGANGAKLLKGTLVEGKPACRSKELLVAIPLPDQTGAPVPEITLKLDAPLTGKAETGAEVQWNGVPSAFTKDPFMLTMDTDKTKIDGLNVTPCAPPPAKKAVPKKKG